MFSKMLNGIFNKLIELMYIIFVCLFIGLGLGSSFYFFYDPTKNNKSIFEHVKVFDKTISYIQQNPEEDSEKAFQSILVVDLIHRLGITRDVAEQMANDLYVYYSTRLQSEDKSWREKYLSEYFLKLYMAHLDKSSSSSLEQAIMDCDSLPDSISCRKCIKDNLDNLSPDFIIYNNGIQGCFQNKSGVYQFSVNLTEQEKVLMYLNQDVSQMKELINDGADPLYAVDGFLVNSLIHRGVDENNIHKLYDYEDSFDVYNTKRISNDLLELFHTELKHNQSEDEYMKPVFKELSCWGEGNIALDCINCYLSNSENLPSSDLFVNKNDNIHGCQSIAMGQGLKKDVFYFNASNVFRQCDKLSIDDYTDCI